MSSYRRVPARALRGLTSSLLLVALAALAAASQAPAAPADHLIISEIVVKTRQVQGTWLGSPFIEIVNPTGSAVDMSDVYLTDGTTAPAAVYWNIVEADPAALNPGGGIDGDFHARFPAGYSLAAGDTVVIAINGSTQFNAAYGYDPDFELFEDDPTPDAVPEMVEAFPGAIDAGPFGGGNVPALSDLSESLVLYTWDGSSNLVQDLDYLLWGGDAAVRVDKTGVVVGGDGYRADTPGAGQDPAGAAGPSFGAAFARAGSDEGAETAGGGNGATGHDETSEDLSNTWAGVGVQDPGTGAVNAAPAAPIFTDAGNVPAAPREDDPVVLSVTVVSPGAVTGVDFHYAVDGGGFATVAGADGGGGTYTAQIPGQPENAVVTWYATAANDGGGQASWPVSAPLYTSGWTTGPAIVPGEGPTKLLLTEISTLGSDQEFIEIHNPSATAVDLTDYYLTDANYTPDNQHYWRIAEGNPSAATIGGGAFNDFHARFPGGYTIAAGGTIVISVPGSDAFEANFDFRPDLELFEDGGAPDDVPDMLWVFGDAANNSIVGGTSPSLTNGAETVILYHWDGQADKVTDIDVFAWKDPGSTTASHFFNKTGSTVGSHAYLDEVGTNETLAFGAQNEFNFSYHRTDDTEGGQTPSGSNGVDGRDETSEDFRATFASLPYDPGFYDPGGGGGPGTGSLPVQLVVPARTFLPREGERFPISFVSRPKGESETKLRLLDMAGRVILTIYDSQFENDPPGNLEDRRNPWYWDGRDNSYEYVDGGMYVLHLHVVDLETGKSETKTAPVVVGTRLSN